MGMLKQSIFHDATRRRMDISDELNSILMTEPYLISFVHMQKHYHTLPGDEEIIACTDGSVIEYGPKYEMLSLPERTYICLHEIGHGIFLHSKRAMLWLLYNGSLYPALWNYAADVVINEGIEANPMMRTNLFRAPDLFPPCRMKTTIHDVIAEVVEKTGEKPPVGYSPLICKDLRVEDLYGWLVWALHAIRRHRGADPMTGLPNPGGASGPSGAGGSKGASGGRGQNGPSERADPDGTNDAEGDSETMIEIMEREDAWDLREHVEDMKDLIRSGTTPEQLAKSIEREVEEARSRIQQAVLGVKTAGLGSGSMLMRLSSDMPKPTVPWDRIIRNMVDGALGVKMAESYHRPGNATLCAMAMGHRNLPVSHGTTIYSPRPRIALGLDVSGSMYSELRRCCSEIWSMAQIKNAEIDLITWDAGVQEVITIRSRGDFDHLLKRGMKGGGGTMVVQGVFEYAERMGHKAIVMITDGYVDIDLPKKPRMPVIWAITPGGATAGLQAYGTIVQMAPDPRVAITDRKLMEFA